MTEKRFTRDEIMEIIGESLLGYYQRHHHNMSRSEYLFFKDIENWIGRNVLYELLKLEKELRE